MVGEKDVSWGVRSEVISMSNFAVFVVLLINFVSLYIVSFISKDAHL